jgi:choline-sulfatase
LLFDLQADPSELTNLAGVAAHQATEAALRGEVMRRWKPHELRDEILASQKRQLFLHRVLGTGRAHPWDFQPWRDATKETCAAERRRRW